MSDKLFGKTEILVEQTGINPRDVLNFEKTKPTNVF